MFVILLGSLLVIGSLFSCSETPTNNGKDTCDTCDTTIPCDTCDTTKPNLDSLSHAFTWTEYSIPGVSSLTGVAVFSDNRIYAFGNDLYIFDGSKWTTYKVYIGSSTRAVDFIDRNVFAFSESNYWSARGSIVYHCDGKFAEEYRDLGPYIDGSLRACWGTSETDMFFVGDYGAVTHFDGTTWTKMPRVTTKNLNWIWGSSHNDVWATGYNPNTDESVLIHYNGTSWKEDEFSTSGQTRQFGIGGVWACDSAGHTFASIAGTRVFRKTDNGPWRKDTSEIGNNLGGGQFVGIGIMGNTPNDILTVGGWGFVSHWNGKTWHRYDELYDLSNSNYAVSAVSMKGNTACVVGTKSGSSWIAIGRRK